MWISQARGRRPDFLHSYVTGLERDRAAVSAAVTLPYRNGRTEGVKKKIILIKRQTYGRTGHRLLHPAHPAQLTRPNRSTVTRILEGAWIAALIISGAGKWGWMSRSRRCCCDAGELVWKDGVGVSLGITVCRHGGVMPTESTRVRFRLFP
ncbi:hypothetical protein OG856_30455 [Streptomyces sp. NBC_01594]